MKQSLKKISKKGFTLIEILIVIGIIAILAAIVLVALNPARQFRLANDAQRQSNVNAILNAIGQYTVDHKGTLPTGIPVGVANVKTISNGGADLCAQLVPLYLPGLPTDPKTGTPANTSLTTCPTTYDTNYSVYQDSASRVTVSATKEESTNPNISVTR